ncbi:hypothetical protein TWF730_010086 [Orbilia blumenaviensis]|uniref:Uncharacterized protein n=1 Tax=Orbilia blumenaviensis TaxID=1796055 RepID=A0AAV9UX46_9PEZI
MKATTVTYSGRFLILFLFILLNSLGSGYTAYRGRSIPTVDSAGLKQYGLSHNQNHTRRIAHSVLFTQAPQTVKSKSSQIYRRSGVGETEGSVADTTDYTTFEYIFKNINPTRRLKLRQAYGRGVALLKQRELAKQSQIDKDPEFNWNELEDIVTIRRNIRGIPPSVREVLTNMEQDGNIIGEPSKYKAVFRAYINSDDTSKSITTVLRTFVSQQENHMYFYWPGALPPGARYSDWIYQCWFRGSQPEEGEKREPLRFITIEGVSRKDSLHIINSLTKEWASRVFGNYLSNGFTFLLEKIDFKVGRNYPGSRSGFLLTVLSILYGIPEISPLVEILDKFPNTLHHYDISAITIQSMKGDEGKTANIFFKLAPVATENPTVVEVDIPRIPTEVTFTRTGFGLPLRHPAHPDIERTSYGGRDMEGNTFRPTFTRIDAMGTLQKLGYRFAVSTLENHLVFEGYLSAIVGVAEVKDYPTIIDNNAIPMAPIFYGTWASTAGRGALREITFASIHPQSGQEIQDIRSLRSATNSPSLSQLQGDDIMVFEKIDPDFPRILSQFRKTSEGETVSMLIGSYGGDLGISGISRLEIGVYGSGAAPRKRNKPFILVGFEPYRPGNTEQEALMDAGTEGKALADMELFVSSVEQVGSFDTGLADVDWEYWEIPYAEVGGWATNTNPVTEDVVIHPPRFTSLSPDGSIEEICMQALMQGIYQVSAGEAVLSYLRRMKDPNVTSGPRLLEFLQYSYRFSERPRPFALPQSFLDLITLLLKMSEDPTYKIPKDERGEAKKNVPLFRPIVSTKAEMRHALEGGSVPGSLGFKTLELRDATNHARNDPPDYTISIWLKQGFIFVNSQPQKTDAISAMSLENALIAAWDRMYNIDDFDYAKDAKREGRRGVVGPGVKYPRYIVISRVKDLTRMVIEGIYKRRSLTKQAILVSTFSLEDSSAFVPHLKIRDIHYGQAEPTHNQIDFLTLSGTPDILAISKFSMKLYGSVHSPHRLCVRTVIIRWLDSPNTDAKEPRPAYPEVFVGLGPCVMRVVRDSTRGNLFRMHHAIEKKGDAWPGVNALDPKPSDFLVLKSLVTGMTMDVINRFYSKVPQVAGVTSQDANFWTIGVSKKHYKCPERAMKLVQVAWLRRAYIDGKEDLRQKSKERTRILPWLRRTSIGLGGLEKFCRGITVTGRGGDFGGRYHASEARTASSRDGESSYGHLIVESGPPKKSKWDQNIEMLSEIYYAAWREVAMANDGEGGHSPVVASLRVVTFLKISRQSKNIIDSLWRKLQVIGVRNMRMQGREVPELSYKTNLQLMQLVGRDLNHDIHFLFDGTTSDPIVRYSTIFSTIDDDSWKVLNGIPEIAAVSMFLIKYNSAIGNPRLKIFSIYIESTPDGEIQGTVLLSTPEDDSILPSPRNGNDDLDKSEDKDDEGDEEDKGRTETRKNGGKGKNKVTSVPENKGKDREGEGADDEGDEMEWEPVI